MKTIFTILFVLLLGTVHAQYSTNFTNINKEKYDSLVEYSWYHGMVFLTNGDCVEGEIRQIFGSPTIVVKLPNGYMRQYSGLECAGFYNVNDKADTAFFLFIDLKNNFFNPKYQALRLMIDGQPDNGISLFRYSWLATNDQWTTNLVKSDAYQINWEYYLWKDGEVTKLVIGNDLKKLLKDKPESLKYYKQYRRDIKHGEYTALSNIINIYNLELYK